MDRELIEDLKQFIASTVSQQTSSLEISLKKEMKQLKEELKVDIQRVDQKVDDLSMAVGEAMYESNAAIDRRVKDHERRIARLEHKVA